MNITYDKSYFVIVGFLFYKLIGKFSFIQCNGTQKYLMIHFLKIHLSIL